jgi:ArsR family transcriptional regulator
VTSKKAPYSSEHLELADMAKALAHPGRLRILEILASSGTCICGEIVEQLPLAQATVSQHLGELKRVGLITGETSGPRTCYCLNVETLKRAWSHFGRLFARVGCCPPQAFENIPGPIPAAEGKKP